MARLRCCYGRGKWDGRARGKRDKGRSAKGWGAEKQSEGREEIKERVRIGGEKSRW